MSGLEAVYSPYVFGIDLGTTNSAIAVSANGRVEVIPIEGQKFMPSVVSFRPGGEVAVGVQARNRILIDPANTIASVKREIGTEWSVDIHGTSYTPEEISEKILRKLISEAEHSASIDLQGTPYKAVICIPANFTDNQKKATLRAAELADLNVVSLLEEPVAAAIAYALERDRDQTVLVYDLGGGTFDVSILEVRSRAGAPAELRVLAKEGIAALGGDDFDLKIMEIAAERLREISEINVLDLKKDQEVSAASLREVQQKLKQKAEMAKHELTESETAHITLPDLLKDGSGVLHSLDMEITREQFEAAIRDLILETKMAIEKALEAASRTIDDISRILLVGGSTRVPLVRTVLYEMFGKEPYSDLDPDTVVAYGAAMYAAGLDVVGERIVVHDKVSHYLGIETFGGRFNWLMAKNDDIPEDEPLRVTKEFTTHRDNMTEIAIRVYQSDEPVEFVGTDGVTYVGEFFLTGIPPSPANREIVTVTFEVDQQNLLKVTAVTSGKSGNLEIKQS